MPQLVHGNGVAHRSPEVLRWLEKILTTRFGVPIHLHADPGGISVSAESAEHAVYVPANNAFQFATGSVPFSWCDVSQAQLRGCVDSRLPAPGGVPGSPLLTSGAQGVQLNYDVLGLMYWMLSRAEEVGSSELDVHDRFPASASHAAKWGYLQRPVVDEWLDVLRQVVERVVGRDLTPSRLPSLSVSHDVDRPLRYGFIPLSRLPRAMVSDVLDGGGPNALKALATWGRAASRLPPGDPYNTFDWIMDQSEARGLKSTFYFLCGRTDPSKDAFYKLSDPSIRNLLRRIRTRGHDVGLHGSYSVLDARGRLRSEFQSLRMTCEAEGISQSEWGGRFHYLRWKTPEAFREIGAAGLAFDNSLTYADHVGFRCGTCHEYPAFDPVKREALPFLIRPLIAMEATLLSKRYMGLTLEAAVQKIRELRHKCEKVGGQFSMLWHNSELSGHERKSAYADSIT